MPVPVTALYAGLTGLLFMGCAILVVRQRMRAGVGLGDGGDEGLLRATRVHANLAEYAPIVLLLLLVYELGGGSPWVLHVLGAVFFLSRLAHAYGLSTSSGRSPGRAAGILGSWVVLVVLALLNLAGAVIGGA
jgi:hypothetical protein